VGKLVKGDDVLKPRVQAFVDDEAGTDVIEKVSRRLQHFIDRKVSALFEPLEALQKDETLQGLARGFAFQMVEALGIIPRDQVANDVKSLDQDARGSLRKHGIRFGQFTIFMPLLLKPAPTRLRLVLTSLFEGLDEFPEAPPPGLVTIPALPAIDPATYTRAGYRVAGERAIRIDMLERLADQLRAEDSRGGFEAKADMLSITGMTLEQFADLMQGLGYKAEKGEREKVKGPSETPAKDAAVEEAKPEVDGEAAAEAAPTDEAPEATQAADAEEKPAEGEALAADAEPVTEVFYTFTWGGFGRRQGGQGRRGQHGQGGDSRQGDRPRGKGGPKGGKPGGKTGGKPGGRRDDRGGGNKPKTFQSRPPKKEKAIDPDNPFAAALMGLKDKS
jgi:ATP-dependent RNA helicase SUPV3L1/SUV3